MRKLKNKLSFMKTNSHARGQPQKIATKIFEHYKLLKSDGSLDLTAAVETTKDLIKDTEWLNVTQSALKVCSTNADDNLATYQSAVKFTKEECNIKYRSIISCLDIYGFAVSLNFFQIMFFSAHHEYVHSHVQSHPGKKLMTAQVEKISFTNATKI